MSRARNVCKNDPKFSKNSLNWKTNLRERCRKRIKEERDQRFNLSRNLPTKEELKSYVLESIQGEWLELKGSNLVNNSFPSIGLYPDIDEDLIIKELEEELLVQEESECRECLAQYQLTEAEYDEYLEELQEDHVICPLCCRKKLVMTCDSDGGNRLSCSGDCLLSKSLPYGIDEVRRRIEFAIQAHSKCPYLPGFTFTYTAEESGLYLVCSECGTIFFVL